MREKTPRAVLLSLLRRHSTDELAVLLGTSARTVQRWKSKQVPIGSQPAAALAMLAAASKVADLTTYRLDGALRVSSWLAESLCPTCRVRRERGEDAMPTRRKRAAAAPADAQQGERAADGPAVAPAPIARPAVTWDPLAHDAAGVPYAPTAWQLEQPTAAERDKAPGYLTGGDRDRAWRGGR